MSRARGKGKPPRTGGGKPPEVEEDWIDPFVRAQVGWKAGREERLLVKLLDAGREVQISGLSRGEAKLLPKLERASQVRITGDGLRVGLTTLGATIARGARNMYPEFQR